MMLHVEGLVPVVWLSILGGGAWAWYSLHLANTEMAALKEHLKNSPQVISTAPLESDGAGKKFVWINNVATCVTFPTFHLKRGELNADDLHNLPLSLRRKLATLKCGITGLVISIALYFALHY